MNSELQKSIVKIYTLFSQYKANPAMPCSPLTVTQADIEKLFARPLQELEGNDLGYYAFKAMTTMGSKSDYKHFLPRILELMVGDLLGYDEEVILGKLVHANWRSWPVEEQEAIEELLINWWTNLIAKKNADIKTIFSVLSSILNSPQKLLHIWEQDEREQSLLNLIVFVFEESDSIFIKKKFASDENKHELAVILGEWLIKDSIRKRVENKLIELSELYSQTANVYDILFNNSKKTM